MLQGGSLARTHEGGRGLPRGRSKLPPAKVSEAQRERLVRAIIAAAAENGYASVTIGDVVKRAKVSRAAFYAHFEGKEECFLAATREGGQLMVDQVITATRDLPATAEPEDVLRAAVRALLAFLAAEPEFARVFYVDMPGAGAKSVDRIDAARFRFANLNRAWLQRARARYPSWPRIPDKFCLAAVGATTELIRAAVHRGEVGSLPDMEDLLVDMHLTLLGGAAGRGR